MRIRRKIAFGYIILIILLFLVQLYQLALARRMLVANQQFSEVDFRVSEKSILLSQARDVLKEFLEKFLATRDDRYRLEVVQRQQILDGHISELDGFGLSPGMRQELELLKQRWNQLSEGIDSIVSVSDDPDKPHPEMLRPWLDHEFDLLRLRSRRIFDETQKAVLSNASHVQVLGMEMRRFSLTVFAIGLAASLILSFLVVRSVSKPLGQLTKGTRRLAKGDFTVLVDESGKDELAELAANFNVMVSRLGELDQLKGDFVSHVSHELKAPLASMQETTRLLMDEIPGTLNEKQLRLLLLNQACSERLSGMIKNLLDLSMIEAGAIHYQFAITDLGDTVQRAIDEFQGLAGEKDLSLEVELPKEPPLIPCDEERCLQVLGNLISNAIKFSKPGGRITVGVECLDVPPSALTEAKRHQLMSRSNRFCVLFVRDRGQGVPDRDKERIFERFFVLTEDRKKPGQGTGLGLAISRKIAEAHSGVLWVEDNPDGGSVFSFLLPDPGLS